MKKFLSEASVRFKSAVPPFFKKLQLIGTAMLALGTSLQALTLPANLQTLAAYIAVSGVVTAAVSQFAQKQG